MSEIVSDVVRKAFASASNYEHVRSEYPVEAVEFLLQKLGVKSNDATSITDRPFTILELGCGTGKFTRVMIKVLTGKNLRVIASEPLQSMCEQFKLMVPDTEIIQCAAEKIRKFTYPEGVVVVRGRVLPGKLAGGVPLYPRNP